jgi:hypothetical protein
MSCGPLARPGLMWLRRSERLAVGVHRDRHAGAPPSMATDCVPIGSSFIVRGSLRSASCVLTNLLPRSSLLNSVMSRCLNRAPVRC